jgi:hypothetical protein
MRGIYGRGQVITGIASGNPFDPVLPVRILVPRNGIGNGQTVLTDEAGLKDVTASLGALTGPGGTKLAGARIRFGMQGAPEGTSRMSTGHWCDALAERPPQNARTIPIWIEVSVRMTNLICQSHTNYR